MLRFILHIALLVVLVWCTSANVKSKSYSPTEIIRYIGTEKHYSNPSMKESFLELYSSQVKGMDTNVSSPVLLLSNVAFNKNDKFYVDNGKQCANAREGHSVVFLSNFSVNRNYSHFLHGLLRLFCALLDAQWIIFNEVTNLFEFKVKYTLWLDPNLRLTDRNLDWFGSLVKSPDDLRPLASRPQGCSSFSTKQLLYGSGCYQMLPPEKWFGYADCRAAELLPLFSSFMKQRVLPSFDGLAELSKLEVQVISRPEIGNNAANSLPKEKTLLELSKGIASSSRAISIFKPERARNPSTRSIPVTPIIIFGIRNQEKVTGQRVISNLHEVQTEIYNNMRVPMIMTNVTFELLGRRDMISLMSNVHVFVSVHGAGMTNMFFMSPRSVVIEIIPWPLCDCKSPDYFYGMGGYYHGSANANKLRHYPYCIPKEDTKWASDTKYKPKEQVKEGGGCSWKYLHSVDAVRIDPSRFLSFYNMVERDLIIDGVVTVHESVDIINPSPHANG